MMHLDYMSIFNSFYPEDTPLRRLLLKHSTQVCSKALEILKNTAGPDEELVTAGAMLHDIGICFCHAPGILCEGTEPYLTHGLIGGRMIRDYAARHGMNLDPIARICERHTGTGITAREIREQGLPLPEQDWLPETPEEKLICLADKFYSKSGNMEEKKFSKVRHSIEKFGFDSVERFDGMCRLFHVKE